MASLNRVCLLGNLGKDAEVREFNSGDKYAKFSIATSEQWKDKHSGEKRERTQWHNVVVYIPQLAQWMDSLSKGERVYVEGQLESRSWDDNDGNKRYITEVAVRPFQGKFIRLSPRGEASQGKAAETPEETIDDDTIPF